jgi:hypothetical protein
MIPFPAFEYWVGGTAKEDTIFHPLTGDSSSFGFSGSSEKKGI